MADKKKLPKTDKVRGALLQYRANKHHENLLGEKGEPLGFKETEAIGRASDSKQWWESDKN